MQDYETFKNSFIYNIVYTITDIMDRKFLDPIVGFIFPALGDTLMSVLVIPYLYISIFMVRSLSLTLAIILNTLTDVIIGIIPYWIGDILDVFYRSYSKNLRLIEGFIRKDEEIISKVNRKAWLMALLIVALLTAIYFIFKLAISVITGGFNLIISLF